MEILKYNLYMYHLLVCVYQSAAVSKVRNHNQKASSFLNLHIFQEILLTIQFSKKWYGLVSVEIWTVKKWYLIILWVPIFNDSDL